MIQLSAKWAKELLQSPETGMGYQVVTFVLQDGRRFEQAAVVEGRVTQIRGRNDIPFTDADIRKIIVTYDKWDFEHD